jgi:anti-sigma regulatory factor (Ser/Thr protein kinase)
MKIILAADISAPGQARAFVATRLETTRLPPGLLVDKVVLTVSELVTNAVQAGAIAVEIDVQVSAGRLDLVVSDDADGWPTPTSAAVDDTAGRGLSIVERLVDTWEVAARPPGKVITASWFSQSHQRSGTNA